MNRFERIRMCDNIEDMIDKILELDYCRQDCYNRTCEKCLEEKLNEEYPLYEKEKDYQLYLKLKARYEKEDGK